MNPAIKIKRVKTIKDFISMENLSEYIRPISIFTLFLLILVLCYAFYLLSRTMEVSTIVKGEPLSASNKIRLLSKDSEILRHLQTKKIISICENDQNDCFDVEVLNIVNDANNFVLEYGINNKTQNLTNKKIVNIKIPIVKKRYLELFLETRREE